MGCVSPDVQVVADQTTRAKQAIDKLQSALESEKDEVETKFFTEIEVKLAEAKIHDGRPIDYNMNIKVEYTYEFSIEKIAAVVTSALQAAIAAQSPTAPNPATSPEALAAYSDVVVAVAEAAKSSSQSAASLSFSMNRLSPGLFAFLYATSTKIADEALFGTEAVTATAIYYRFMQSIDDIKNQATFDEALIDRENLIAMKKLQAGLTDRLARCEITMNDWIELDGQMSGMIKTIRDRLNGHEFGPGKALVAARVGQGIIEDHVIVRQAISALKTMGPEYVNVIRLSQERLVSGYF